MKYLIMIFANQETWAGFGAEETAQAIAEQDAVNKDLFETGELLGAYGLADAEASKVVRVREGAARSPTVPTWRPRSTWPATGWSTWKPSSGPWRSRP